MQNVQQTGYFKEGQPVTSPPKSLRIDLNKPDDNLLVFEPSVVVSGKSAPLSDVLIMTDTQHLIIKSSSNGDFSTVLELDEGINRITVTVFDITGDSRSADRTIFYSEEKI